MPDKLNKFLSRNLRKSNVSIDIDLSELLPDRRFSEQEKESIAQRIINKIVENSESGIDRLGRPLPKYSKDYKESDAFTAFGKSNDPNMTLTGDLMGQLDILKIAGNTVRIGWDSELENAKAHGNITGQEGKWKKKRDFFGLTTAELKEIISGEDKK